MKKRKVQCEKYLVCTIALVLFGIFSWLFYRQAVVYDGKYWSDLPDHIRLAVAKRGYSVLYYIIGELYRISKGRVWIIAMFESLMVILTWLLSGKMICELLEEVKFERACMIALPFLFLSGICLPYIHSFFYRRQLITQPYHNITYYGMRLFAVCVMIVFINVFKRYLERISVKEWFLLSLFLALSTAIKPNFFLGFSFSLLIFLIIDFIKTRFEKSAFFHIVLMGMVVFPSLFILKFQSRILYGKTVEKGGTGIALVMGVNFVKSGAGVALFRVLCSLTFPMLVLYVNKKNIDRIGKFIYMMFFVQFAVCLLFAETGARESAGNFWWGCYCSAFFLFIYAFLKFRENTRQGAKMWYKVIGGILISAHIISGFIYFILICQGNNPLM